LEAGRRIVEIPPAGTTIREYDSRRFDSTVAFARDNLAKAKAKYCQEPHQPAQKQV